MRYDPERHHRRSIRLPGYDYSQAGTYFVTICTQGRACLFGRVVEGDIRLNRYGEIVRSCWLDIPMHFPKVELDEFVVMPNHVHGIIVISVGARFIAPNGAVGSACVCVEDEGVKGAGVDRSVVGGALSIAPNGSASGGRAMNRVPTIGEIVRGFKARAAVSINRLSGALGRQVWQRNYYEHIIRDEESLNKVREYILGNPLGWELDRENPLAIESVPPKDEPWRI